MKIKQINLKKNYKMNKQKCSKYNKNLLKKMKTTILKIKQITKNQKLQQILMLMIINLIKI